MREQRISPLAFLFSIVGLVAVLAAAVVFAVRQPGDSPRTSLAQQVDNTPSATATQKPPRLVAPGTAKDGPPPTATPTPSPTPSPTPTPIPQPEGLRVWSHGDSTSYFVSAAFLQLMTARGAIQVQPAPDYIISSGLMNPGYFDWPSFLASQMAAYDPQIVVFMVGANDAWAPPETYRQYVAAVMDQLQGRVLVWVGQPNMGRADLAASLPGLNAVMAEEAAKRDWVIYIDAWSLTSDANGYYTAYAADGTLLRADDGVHLTSAGGYIIASAILAALGY